MFNLQSLSIYTFSVFVLLFCMYCERSEDVFIGIEDMNFHVSSSAPLSSELPKTNELCNIHYAETFCILLQMGQLSYLQI